MSGAERKSLTAEERRFRRNFWLVIVLVLALALAFAFRPYDKDIRVEQLTRITENSREAPIQYADDPADGTGAPAYSYCLSGGGADYAALFRFDDWRSRPFASSEEAPLVTLYFGEKRLLYFYPDNLALAYYGYADFFCKSTCWYRIPEGVTEALLAYCETAAKGVGFSPSLFREP